MYDSNSWQPADPDVARLKDRLSVVRSELSERISAIEEGAKEQWRQERTGREARKTRTWQALLALVTCIVGPLTVVGILALIHLRGG